MGSDKIGEESNNLVITMNDYNNIPLYGRLLDHIGKDSISLHVPGHKNGLLYKGSQEAYAEALKLDVTELSGLDDLHAASGAIKEAELLASKLYGAKESSFLINGSTVGNLAMILGTVKEGETVLVQRNCHKSVLNGIRLAKASPVFLGPEYNGDWGVAGGIAPGTVEKAISLHPDAKAIILTYPNYYGMVFDLQAIIHKAHQHGIPVLVDEAHGAHLIKMSRLKSAVELGADFVVQSAHKTLPAMTMGAYLHYNSRLIGYEGAREYLQMLQSSSPSYPIMASLDGARHYLETFTEEDDKILLERIESFRRGLAVISGLLVLEYEEGAGDPLKVVIQPEGLSGFELQSLLEDEGIYPEMADPYNVVFVLPLLKKDMDFPFKEIIFKTEKAMSGKRKGQTAKVNYFQKPSVSTLAVNAQDLMGMSRKAVSMEEAAGKICAELIIPYPPGIPLLFPGEVISEEDVKSIRLLQASGARFQGGSYLDKNQISIYALQAECKQEEHDG
ncbi:aminotransferase class V-fold PLP-dependent enzyme [Bacillus infantis]|nr:aminotransferase class V-fold PLP-dependent enzyme [Bacillus infantis]